MTETSRILIPLRRFERSVLSAVVDRTGRGGTRKVKEAFEEVERRYAAKGHEVRWPVSSEIVSMPIMGATKSAGSAHTLFVSRRAVESDMLDGLIAHEMGHMLRTEARHASHDPEVFRALPREVRIPRSAGEAFDQAFNHIQDIYADDLAFLVFGEDAGGRVYEFFASWVEGNGNQRGGDRWRNIGLAASSGFAIGNLVRHGLIEPSDPLWKRARAFDAQAGLSTVDALVRFYANLSVDPSPAAFIGEVKALADLMTRAANA